MNELEKSIDCLETVPTNFVACKCTSNPERSLILEKLVKLSEDCMKIEGKVEQVKKEENCASVRGPCDLVSFWKWKKKTLYKPNIVIDKKSSSISRLAYKNLRKYRTKSR